MVVIGWLSATQEMAESNLVISQGMGVCTVVSPHWIPLTGASVEDRLAYIISSQILLHMLALGIRIKGAGSAEIEIAEVQKFFVKLS